MAMFWIGGACAGVGWVALVLQNLVQAFPRPPHSLRYGFGRLGKRNASAFDWLAG